MVGPDQLLQRPDAARRPRWVPSLILLRRVDALAATAADGPVARGAGCDRRQGGRPTSARSRPGL